jgi:hypothetical protein
MATNTAGTSARRDPRNVTNTLRLTINYNDVGVSTGIAFANYLPQGAFITGAFVEVVTAFNAGTTNVITVGTVAGSVADVVASGVVTGGTPGVYWPASGNTTMGRKVAAAGDVQILAKYAQTGTAATTGQAVIVIEFEGGWTN